MVGKALETICAFANTVGGWLVLGIADRKECKGTDRLFGVEENPEATDELQRKLRTMFLPDISGLDATRLTCRLHSGPAKGQIGHVWMIRVNRSDRVHSVLDGGTYMRLDAGNRIMTAGEVTELSYRRGERSATKECEAIVNAVIHRDYRFNRDIFVRIFDDRVEVESPGLLPGNITPATIAKAGSKSRNPLIASNLREFPAAPNIDAGEGVRMMFAEMAEAELYPPQYRQNSESAIETLTVTLFNTRRPSAWDEVSDWVDRHGAVANADVVRIARLDTLKASKLLTSWRDQGWLVALPGRAKRNMAYTKPSIDDLGSPALLSGLSNNKCDE